MTIESLPSGRENNFNLLRMFAASAVIVSHSYPLSLGIGATEPLQSLLGFSLGSLAVKMFFAISGFFILKSFDRRTSNWDFVAARVLRLVPALVVVAIISAFVIGPLFTKLGISSYLSSIGTWIYVPRTVSLIWWSDTPLGLFAENPFPTAVNGPLWTLYFEVFCYICLFLGGIAGIFARRWFPVTLVAYCILYLLARYVFDLKDYAALSLPFLIGMSVYRYRDRVPLKAWMALALLAFATMMSIFDFGSEESSTLAIGYIALWLGFAKAPFLANYNKLGDYSYGVYIYGWPMQQIGAATFPGISPLALACFAFPFALICAVLSWRYVERPSLGLRRELGSRLAVLSPIRM